MTVAPFLLLLAATAGWILLPLLPAIRELVAPTDAEPLNAVGHDAGDLTVFADAWRLWWQVVQGVEFEGLGKLIEQYGDDAIKKSADNQFAAMHRIVSGFELNDYVGGYARRAALVRDLQLALQEYPILVLPISAEQTFGVDADVRDVDRMEEVVKAQWPMMSVAALSVPGLSVPVTVANGLPTSVQLLGGRFREDTLFAAGRAIESRASVPSPVDPR